MDLIRILMAILPCLYLMFYAHKSISVSIYFTVYHKVATVDIIDIYSRKHIITAQLGNRYNPQSLNHCICGARLWYIYKHQIFLQAYSH